MFEANIPIGVMKIPLKNSVGNRYASIFRCSNCDQTYELKTDYDNDNIVLSIYERSQTKADSGTNAEAYIARKEVLDEFRSFVGMMLRTFDPELYTPSLLAEVPIGQQCEMLAWHIGKLQGMNVKFKQEFNKNNVSSD